MSFYRSFASKDELVAEYLRGEEREGWRWWTTRWPRTGRSSRSGRGAVRCVGEDHLQRELPWLRTRQCGRRNHGARPSGPSIVEKYKAEMRRRFRHLAREMGARDADALGDALMLLWEGSHLTRLSFSGQHGPAQGAAKAARVLIDAYTADTRLSHRASVSVNRLSIACHERSSAFLLYAKPGSPCQCGGGGRLKAGCAAVEMLLPVDSSASISRRNGRALLERHDRIFGHCRDCADFPRILRPRSTESGVKADHRLMSAPLRASSRAMVPPKQ